MDSDINQISLQFRWLSCSGGECSQKIWYINWFIRFLRSGWVSELLRVNEIICLLICLSCKHRVMFVWLDLDWKQCMEYEWPTILTKDWDDSQNWSELLEMRFSVTTAMVEHKSIVKPNQIRYYHSDNC